MSATISSKGQITVPKAVREALGLKPGDAVDFVIKEGQAFLRRHKVWTVDELAGSLNHLAKGPALSPREEDAALVKAMLPRMRRKFFGKKR